jgi:hypothetical protein
MNTCLEADNVVVFVISTACRDFSGDHGGFEYNQVTIETKPDLWKGTHIDNIMNEITNCSVELEIGEPSYSSRPLRRSSEIAQVQKEQADVAGDMSESENYKVRGPNIMSFAEM